MKIAVAGLGKMGQQIISKLHDADQLTLGIVRRPEQAEELGREGLSVTTDKSAVLDFFGSEQPVLWLMIPADYFVLPSLELTASNCTINYFILHA